MAAAVRGYLMAGALVLGTPAAAWAGMPAITLTDVARLRVQTLSFFLMGVLASAWCVQRLWSYLRQDFAFLPRLSYCKAVSLVGLWGLLFVLVLTMISGARELMTPGAWEKQGWTYRLAPAPSSAPAGGLDESDLPERRQKLDRLRTALWSYARSHEGRFPERASVPEIPVELWLVLDLPPLRYHYLGGQHADQEAAPLAYEPEVHGEPRLVLCTNGTIQAMTVEEIVKALPAEKP